MNIGIYIYDQAEVLDFSGPFEVFSTAARICTDGTPFTPFLVSQTGETVTARGGYKVIPDYGFHNHPLIDVPIIVGGVHIAEMLKPPVVNWITEQANTAKLMASVCTGAFLLAAAQVITTESVTTHWEDIADLRQQYPNLNVRENIRWVDAGRVITSGGISAGIDMSLYLVSRLGGQALAEQTAKQMEFDWTGAS
ncbi:glutamine amidotransferase [Leptolyngbya sp. Heron Island J]|uniref:DJ-1/PfpI family protein n=1 Tax=Leptolyngbya sp. Heron Island J TaxID=1385935 RepID=UPI0003B9D30D|nr:DJ-1/PfpI family protein [Leptolyngbya sp. Heron Island J]ESA38860.1 glutamine amidotransferase [Leptolyngbya sp. Heron Island J]